LQTQAPTIRLVTVHLLAVLTFMVAMDVCVHHVGAIEQFR
jgi:hypothetical protein